LSPQVWLHEGYSRSEDAVRNYLRSYVPDTSNGRWLLDTLRIVDEGYAYKDTAPRGVVAPFPCNPWYDLKAWHWLEQNTSRLEGPILFWNVGE
jgi:hypothetical protein